MSTQSLEDFTAHRLAMEMWDLVVEDMAVLTPKPVMERLVAQQLGSADSIAANIEEGHGRETTREYVRFLVIARGSARETKGRYIRLRRWFKPELIADRTARCDHVIAILTKTIVTLSQRRNRPSS